MVSEFLKLYEAAQKAWNTEGWCSDEYLVAVADATEYQAKWETDARAAFHATLPECEGMVGRTEAGYAAQRSLKHAEYAGLALRGNASARMWLRQQT